MALKKNDNTYFMEKELLSPYTYLLQVRGKQTRLKIPLAFNHWLQVPDNKVHEILKVVNMLHMAGLLIDDIQDYTNVRRGLPAAHLVYGVPLTLNTTLHLMCLAHTKFNHLHPKAGDIMMEHVLDATHGQGCDIYWREHFVCPTEKQYLMMTEQKTGAMFKLVVRLIQLFSKNKTDFSKLLTLVGQYFQIRDDYCNLIQQEALEEWPGEEDKEVCKENTFCEDISEGKFSLPVIHSMKTSECDEISEILRKRTQDFNLKKHCILLLEKSGSLEYTRDRLTELDQEVRNEVAHLGGNPMMEAVLDELLSWKS